MSRDNLLLEKMINQKLLAQGAEAKIFLVQQSSKVAPNQKKTSALTKFSEESKREQDSEQSNTSKASQYIVKDRIPKSYRLKILDERIRKRRTKSEAKILEKINKIIPSPKVFKSDSNKIELEFIDGKKLSSHLNEYSLKEQIEICNKLGKEISKLHEANIIHGDLTTSNMILVEDDENKKTLPLLNPDIKNSSSLKSSSRKNLAKPDLKQINLSEAKVFLIDFGLSFHSLRLEDKAVDIYLLKEALEAKHFENWKKLFESVLKSYKNKDVIERLKKVESRGRYKERY